MKATNAATLNRLLDTYQYCTPNTLDDSIYLAALAVEDAMLTGGASPGVDYTFKDLFTLGVALMPHMFEDIAGKPFTTAYPSGHPGEKKFTTITSKTAPRGSEAKPSPLSALFEGNDPFFPSEHAARWFLRKHQKSLAESGAILMLRGRIFVDLTKFNLAFMEIGRQQAIDRTSR